LIQKLKDLQAQYPNFKIKNKITDNNLIKQEKNTVQHNVIKEEKTNLTKNENICVEEKSKNFLSKSQISSKFKGVDVKSIYSEMIRIKNSNEKCLLSFDQFLNKLSLPDKLRKILEKQMEWKFKNENRGKPKEVKDFTRKSPGELVSE